MRSKSLLVFYCIFKCVGLVLATCTVSKYEEGNGNRVQCSNETLSAVLDQGGSIVGAIMIFQSQLNYIPQQAFAKHARSLQSLNIHQCKIREIHRSAFEGLSSLKKLSLPNNNLTELKDTWFRDAMFIEQLDLSFNMISSIEPIIFSGLRAMKRLDVRENRLTCFDPTVLQPMGALDKFRFSGNPLSFQCRGKLTLWLRDHGVNYQSDVDETWLDSLLWLCIVDDPKVAEIEVLMKECVFLNLFNQLRTGLTTSQSYPPTVSSTCSYTRDLLTDCIANTGRIMSSELTNGHVIKRLLLYLRDAKSVA